MGMIKRGGEMDLSRAATYFVRWWREEGGLIAASESQALYQGSIVAPVSGEHPRIQASHPLTDIQGWGFDLEWEVRPDDITPGVDFGKLVQEKMEKCLTDYMIKAEEEEKTEANVSDTQKKKQMLRGEKMKREMKHSRRSA
jgi:hypothetical protein